MNPDILKLYRVGIIFSDGGFKVDVWASTPDRALGLALIDARMAHANTVYAGDVLEFLVEPVCELRTDAHAMSDELEAKLLENFGVRITERDKAPWEWCFIGTRAQLQAMWREHWTSEGVPPPITEVRK